MWRWLKEAPTAIEVALFCLMILIWLVYGAVLFWMQPSGATMFWVQP